MAAGSRFPRPMTRIGVAVALVGVLAACGSPKAVSGRGPNIAADEVVLPIDAYAYTVSEVGRLGRARTMLIRECMHRFGFEFGADAAAGADQATQNNVKDHGRYGNKRRYGVLTEAKATEYGYHLPSTVDGMPSEGHTGGPRGLGKPTRAKVAVLSGTAPDGGRPGRVNGRVVPEGGCVGTARAEIAGDETESLGEADLVARISRDSFRTSMKAPEVTAVFDKWSRCMEAEGHNYPNPVEAGQEFDIDTAKVSPAEIAAAKEDVACKKETDLVDIWSSVETEYQRARIEQNAAELQEIKAEHDARMKRAAKILASAP